MLAWLTGVVREIGSPLLSYSVLSSSGASLNPHLMMSLLQWEASYQETPRPHDPLYLHETVLALKL